ncbi:hypothetical protein RJ639_018993 [Escallonia herrerae]|uniref:LOB domain-containing protein n=1 Tax=Escallonia herrerae TaxID=1293975 RepID=A0AA89AIU2_9ASTE|nr:hypothetical protein RJ639_018993 [Escallonia herrerae]
MTRCAACKYPRRRCASDCIFSPYFTPNNPQRFACVHRIYGASNIGKMLQQLPIHRRAEAADCLCYEAQCRMKDREIHDAQSQLAIAQAEIAFLNASSAQEEPPQQQQHPAIEPAKQGGDPQYYVQQIEASREW